MVHLDRPDRGTVGQGQGHRHPPGEGESFSDRVAHRIHRTVTRREFIQRATRWGLFTGIALAAPFTIFQGRAWAGTCGPGGVVGTYGCLCASTQSCSSCSTSGCGASLRPRCNAWTTPNPQGNYCWCSLTCCTGGKRGFYACCDCWQGGSGDCGVSGGSTACVCKHYHFLEFC